MKLYHGSNTDIKQIDLDRCRPNKDFGKGFYLTTIREQAVRMASRVSRIYGGSPILNVYDLNEGLLDTTDLSVKSFAGPCEAWAKFVIANRNGTFAAQFEVENNLDSRYDIVIGPVANDDLALLFRQFEDSLISVETLIHEMEFKKLTDQYSFHTTRAIQLLSKMDVEYV